MSDDPEAKEKTPQSHAQPSSPPPKEGEVIHYEGGKVALVQNYAAGVLEGESRVYDPKTGLLLRRMFYKEGVLHGPFETYTKGALSMQFTYAKGKKTGPCIFYAENGMIQARGYYHDGKFHGAYVAYDEGGYPCQITMYEHGIKDGAVLTYFPSGALVEKGMHHNDLKEGPFIGYYETGEVRSVKHYRGGALAIPAVMYDQKGNEMHPAGSSKKRRG